MKYRRKDDIDITGFAGVRERVYVMDNARFGAQRPDSALDGIGPLHYLADAFMRPQASTGLHRHDNVVIVTLMVNGSLTHQGSLGDGQRLDSGDIQVQYSGANGFSHNEINPGPDYCRFLQLWLTPAMPVASPGYAVTPLAGTGTLSVALPDALGDLSLEIHQLPAGDHLALRGDTLLYLASGALRLAGETALVDAQTAVRGEDLRVTANADSLLVSAQRR